MNNRVNIKFVILLCSVFVLSALGVGYVAYTKLTTSGDEYAHRAELAAEEGDYKSASESYGRAVAHDRTRQDWLERWLYMLERYVPETDVEFNKNYYQFYLGIYSQLAALELRNASAQSQLLDLQYQRLIWQQQSPEAWQQLVENTSTAIAQLDMAQPESLAVLRYRGIAVVRQMEQYDPPETIRERAVDDLRSALAGNPLDIDSAFSLGRWYLLEWRRARRDRNDEMALQREDELSSVISLLRDTFEDHPRALLSAFELDINKALTGSSGFTQRQIAIRSLIGTEEPILLAFENTNSELISSLALDRLVTVMGLLHQTDGFRSTLPILKRVTDNRPDDIEALVVLGRVYTALHMPEEAIRTYQQLVDLPALPVGLDGLLQRGFRLTAIQSQAENALQLAESFGAGEERAAAKQQFLEFRDSLSSKYAAGQNAAPILMLEARHSMLNKNYEHALLKLTAYKRETAANTNEVLRLQARCYIGINQLGAARESIEALLIREPDNTQALLLAIEIDRRLREPRRAFNRLQAAIRSDPDNEELKAVLAEVQARLGVVSGDDEVLATIVQAQQLLRDDSRETAEAETLLTTMLTKYPDDERAISAYIDFLIATQRRDEALLFAQESIARIPESARIEQTIMLLEADSPMQYAMQRIDIEDISDVERHMRKAAIYRSNGQPEQAEEHIQQAEGIDSEHPQVLEYRFAAAIEREDDETAQSILARAIQANADDVGGQIFEALYKQSKSQHAEAAEILEGVLTEMPFSVRAQQMLGQSYLALGRTNEAVEALRKSYEARPDNTIAARALIDALQRIQRYSEALDIARRTSDLNPSDALVRQIRLALEGLAGDQQYAIREHRNILEQLPENRRSRIALIQLLLGARQWDEAQIELRIAESILGGDDPDYLLQQARWHGLQRDFDTGLQFLHNVSQVSSDPGTAFLVSDYAIEFELVEAAIESFGVAVGALPDEANRRLADYLFSLERYEEATVPYKLLWEQTGNESSQMLVGLRLSEAYIRLGQWDDAERLLNDITGVTQQSIEILLLRAAIHEGQEERRAAFDLLNQAVAAAPANPIPFLRRAQFNINNPNLYADVIADLEQVLRLQPNSIIARQMRAGVLISRGRIAEALSELRRAVETDPANQELSRLYVLQLVATGNWTDATIFVDAAVQRFGDAEWLSTAGQVYLQAAIAPKNNRNSNNLMLQALGYFRRMHQELQNAESGVRFAMVALDVTPPAAQEALQALNELVPEMLSSNTRLLLLHARALFHTGSGTDALRDLGAALGTAKASDEIKLWFAEAPRLFSSQADMLRFVDSVIPPEELSLHFEVQNARLLASDVARHSELIEFLLQAEDQATSDDELMVDILRLRGALEYQTADYVASTASMNKGVAILPLDLEFNNNLAYLLVNELNDFQAALAPSERAATVAPNDPVVLDTLGWVQYRTDQIAQAESTLQRALDLSENPQQELPINIHLAWVKLTLEEFRTSRRFADRAAELIRRSPELGETYQTELDALIQALKQAEDAAGFQQ